MNNICLWRVELVKNDTILIRSFTTYDAAKDFISKSDKYGIDILFGPWNMTDETESKFNEWLIHNFPDLYKSIYSRSPIFLASFCVKIGKEEDYFYGKYYKLRDYIKKNEHMHEFWML